MNGRAAQKESIELIVLDVDGVMTDGTLLYGDGETTEIKSFNIKDGLGIKLLQRYGIEVAIITGRRSSALERRAAELEHRDPCSGQGGQRRCLARTPRYSSNRPRFCRLHGR